MALLHYRHLMEGIVIITIIIIIVIIIIIIFIIITSTVSESPGCMLYTGPSTPWGSDVPHGHPPLQAPHAGTHQCSKTGFIFIITNMTIIIIIIITTTTTIIINIIIIIIIIISPVSESPGCMLYTGPSTPWGSDVPHGPPPLPAPHAGNRVARLASSGTIWKTQIVTK